MFYPKDFLKYPATWIFLLSSVLRKAKKAETCWHMFLMDTTYVFPMGGNARYFPGFY